MYCIIAYQPVDTDGLPEALEVLGPFDSMPQASVYVDAMRAGNVPGFKWAADTAWHFHITSMEDMKQQ